MIDEAIIAMPASMLERLLGVLDRLDARLGGAASPADALLTKHQVADFLGGASIRKVERLVKSGKLKAVPNLGKRMVRFRACDVERLLVDRDERPGRRRL